MELAKMTKKDLEAKLLISTNEDEKATIRGLLASKTYAKAKTPAKKESVEPEVIDSLEAAQEFGKSSNKKSMVKKDTKKAAPKKAAPKKAASKKAAPKKAAPKKAAPKKAAKTGEKKAVKPRKEGALVSFKQFRTDETIKGHIVREIIGTDDLPYVGVRDSAGVIRFKKKSEVKFL